MSIQSQIDRIVGFRNASLTAVANKGVNVPSDATIDDLPDLIDEIQTGSVPVLQSKSAAPAENAQLIEPDSGYDGLSAVQIGAISTTYVGSGITRRSSSDLTTSGATVTVPAGYYSVAASKSFTVYNGAHHQPAPSSYTVTVSLTNPANASGFGHCTIFEALSDDPYDGGQQITEISSPTGTATISVPASVYGILVNFSGLSLGGGTASATENVSFSSGDVSTGFVFHVTGDGTANIDGIDYDD